MVELTDVRRGELARKFLMHKLREDGVRLGPDFRRKVGSMAKAMNVPFDEAMAFIEELMRTLMDEMFAEPSGEKEGDSPADK